MRGARAMQRFMDAPETYVRTPNDPLYDPSFEDLTLGELTDAELAEELQIRELRDGKNQRGLYYRK